MHLFVGRSDMCRLAMVAAPRVVRLFFFRVVWFCFARARGGPVFLDEEIQSGSAAVILCRKMNASAFLVLLLLLLIIIIIIIRHLK